MITTLDLIRVGARLREARKQRGLTQQELGGLIGAAASWISDLEKGKQRGLAAESVLRLSQALCCTSDYLLGLTPARVPAGDDARS